MNKLVVALFVSLAITGCQSTGTSGTDTGSSNNTVLATNALLAATQMWSGMNATNPVADQLAQQTNVTNEQALGGLGSMLALAQNSLSGSQSQELAGMMPGYSSLQQSGLSALIASPEMMNTAFNALGMDPSLVSSFAPIVLQLLQTQGASSTLVNSLGALWQ
ncbi:DUF2780 domain-containing protein [Vibrio sp.]|uniref:DUF2780 domain-containing protein n=1 Tax=Vibrio sp. TaxID=678 RepID=UPI003D148D5D